MIKFIKYAQANITPPDKTIRINTNFNRNSMPADALQVKTPKPTPVKKLTKTQQMVKGDMAAQQAKIEKLKTGTPGEITKDVIENIPRETFEVGKSILQGIGTIGTKLVTPLLILPTEVIDASMKAQYGPGGPPVET